MDPNTPKEVTEFEHVTIADEQNLEAAQKQLVQQLEGENGYRIDPKLFAETAGLKLSSDGRNVLIPQPNDDPNNPLNWSHGKKALILGIITAASFLPDYGSATGAVTLIPQSKYESTQNLMKKANRDYRRYWGITVEEVSHSLAGNVFMLGMGGLATVILSAYFGRLPVLFWFTVANLLSAIWCASARTFPAFEAGRIVNGFFSTVAQAVCQFDLPRFGQNLTGF